MCPVCKALFWQNDVLTFRSIYCTLLSERGGVHLLICNLASILQEKRKSITEVSNATGISRTTLTALSSNKSAGIQFETINTLCSFLDIQPGDLFLYSSLNIEPCKFFPDADSIHYLGNSVLYRETISFRFSQGWSGTDEKFSLTADINAKFDASNNILSVDMALSDSQDENLSVLQSLPSGFLSALEREISFDHVAVSSPLGKLTETHTSGKTLRIKYEFHWPAGIGK